MKFKDKKEYYSLRKFKGVGLASALVGLVFLSPSVLAEETVNPSAHTGDVDFVVPTVKPTVPVTSETVNVTSASSVVENSTTSGNSSKQEDVVKSEEVTKSEEVVKPVVSESPDISSSLRVEESSQDVKLLANDVTTADTNKSDPVESSQATRSRRGKRDVSG